MKNILSGESCSHCGISVVYCRDNEITDLNYRFKGRRRTTDVLAFGLADSDDPDFLGEVYVNLQQARRQAVDVGVPYKEEIKRLTAHGVLHLLGYRDDIPRKRDAMWRRQEAYIGGGKGQPFRNKK